MSNEEIKTKVAEQLKSQDLMVVHDVTHVNHNPHPYMIGPKHIKYCADNHGGMMTPDNIRDLTCSHPGCHLLPHQHTSDQVCFLQLKRNCTQKEAQEVLKGIVDALGEKAFDGFGFIDTPDKFRIQ